MAFGRFARPVSAQPMSEINVTPMVDVMLVLLVIFMITAPWLGRALHLDLPKAQAASLVQAGPSLDIGLKADGSVWLNGEAVTWRDLPGRLDALTHAVQGPLPAVRLAADASVKYEEIVRVMDVLQQNGLGQIGFLTRPVQNP